MRLLTGSVIIPRAGRLFICISFCFSHVLRTDYSSSSTLFLPNLGLSHSKHPQLEDGPAEPSLQELLDRTLFALQKAEIALVEWGTLLHNRMGVPTILKVSFYI